MLLPVFICRHLDVDWLTTHTCRCTECGRFGHWYEDGLVVWTRGTADPARTARAAVRLAARPTATIPPALA